MTRTHSGFALLLAGTLLAGCRGDNQFPTDPVNTGGGSAARGSIGGQVTANGLGVAGAVVSVTGGAAGSTDAAGQYRIEGLSAGAYRVLLQVPAGFGLAPGDSAARSVNVARGQRATVNWQLLRPTGGP